MVDIIGDQIDAAELTFVNIANAISTMLEGEIPVFIPKAFAASCLIELIMDCDMDGPLIKDNKKTNDGKKSELFQQVRLSILPLASPSYQMSKPYLLIPAPEANLHSQQLLLSMYWLLVETYLIKNQVARYYLIDQHRHL